MLFFRAIGVGVAMVAATWLLGWWTVPVLAAAYGFFRPPESGAASEAALGAVLGWGALLAWNATHPAFGRLSSAVGGALTIPTVVLMLIALAFAGLLAWAAARLATPQRRAVTAPRPR